MVERVAKAPKDRREAFEAAEDEVEDEPEKLDTEFKELLEAAP